MSIESENNHINAALPPEEQARHLHQEITSAGFDMNQFDQLFPIFQQLKSDQQKKVDKLKKELEEEEIRLATVNSFQSESKEHMEKYLTEFQAKFKKLTEAPTKVAEQSEEHAEQDEDQDNIGLPPGLEDTIGSVFEQNGGFLDDDLGKPEKSKTFSYLSAAQQAQNKNFMSNGNAAQAFPMADFTTIKRLYITNGVGIHGIVCSNPENAPTGHLYWNPKKLMFGLKLMVGNTIVNFEGNIGNIFVKGDKPTNVELCRRSRDSKTCIRHECTYRHVPPKRGEVRNWYSAPTYMPSWQASMAKEQPGVHRIGSREHLKEDLGNIREPESREARDAYVEQAFHFMLVALAIKNGVVLDNDIEKYPSYMDPQAYRT